MFGTARRFNSDISNWDTSKVTDMSASRSLFLLPYIYIYIYNIYIHRTSYRKLIHLFFHLYSLVLVVFQFANEFNGDLSKWDISKATSLSSTFAHTYRFARKEQLDVAWEASNPTAYPGSDMYTLSLQSATCGSTLHPTAISGQSTVTCSAQALPAKHSTTRCFDCFHDGKEW